MKKIKRISAVLLMIFVLATTLSSYGVAAANDVKKEALATETTQDASKPAKAIGSGIAIGLAGLGGALGMGFAISKANEGISRQPEAEEKIRSSLMIGLVFIETVVIYALIVTILIIFVL